ncbi:MAG: hypothetical protein HQK53_14085 [Oligoflexia bacterium]|nr:hypothetical protein [Oligoflexia bacterium]
MLLENKEIIERPRHQVYTLVRDKLSLIASTLPNIEKVTLVENRYSATDNLTHVLNHWYAKVEIPDVAKRFVKSELFSWKDRAVWDNNLYTVDYTLESFWSEKIFDAHGKNYFRELSPGITELELTCEIIVHPDKVPGVPSFLVKSAMPFVEEMMKKVLEPNLLNLGKAIREYIIQQHL